MKGGRESERERVQGIKLRLWRLKHQTFILPLWMADQQKKNGCELSPDWFCRLGIKSIIIMQLSQYPTQYGLGYIVPWLFTLKLACPLWRYLLIHCSSVSYSLLIFIPLAHSLTPLHPSTLPNPAPLDTSKRPVLSLLFPSCRAGFLEFQMWRCVPHRPLSRALSFISGGLVHRVLRQPELSTGKGPRSGGGPLQPQLRIYSSTALSTI